MNNFPANFMLVMIMLIINITLPDQNIGHITDKLRHTLSYFIVQTTAQDYRLTIGRNVAPPIMPFMTVHPNIINKSFGSGGKASHKRAGDLG